MTFCTLDMLICVLIIDILCCSILLQNPLKQYSELQRGRAVGICCKPEMQCSPGGLEFYVLKD